MFVGFLTWWYGDGLNARIASVGERLARVNDFFSVGLLARTLFSPFRQLTAGRVRGSLDAQIRALIDNIIGRLIGAFLRTTMIFIALFASVGVVLYGIAVVFGWLLLPILPIGGLFITFIGKMV